MKRFTEEEYKIFENVAQAKSILRENGGDIEDENFLKIVDATKKDGWTGLLTRFVYKDGIDVDEVISLYPDLKSSKLDLGKLNKMNYDDIIDLLYQGSNDESQIEFIARYEDYLIYRIHTYESNLKICSPSWCLKTKTFWDRYVGNDNVQFIAIQENYANKRGKTKLLYPDHPGYLGDYTNRMKPEVRYGITFNVISGKWDIFNDDNKMVDPYSISGILSEIKAYLEENGIGKMTINDDNKTDTDYLCDYLFSYASDEGLDYSFSHMFNDNISNSITMLYNDEPQYMEALERAYRNKRSEFISRLGQCCGFLDAILYHLDGKVHNMNPQSRFELGGIKLLEQGDSTCSYKLIYGFNQTEYGKLYIEQSFNNLSDFGEYIVRNPGSVFLDDMSHSSGDINGYFYATFGWAFSEVFSMILDELSDDIIMDEYKFKSSIDMTRLFNMIYICISILKGESSVDDYDNLPQIISNRLQSINEINENKIYKSLPILRGANIDESSDDYRESCEELADNISSNIMGGKNTISTKLVQGRNSDRLYYEINLELVNNYE